jgi:hypothetical protein
MTMNAKRGYYSLIQFCPDPSRAETVNLGVLLFCPEAGFIRAHTSASNRRAAKLIGPHKIDSASLNSAKRAMERRLEVDRESFQTLDVIQSMEQLSAMQSASRAIALVSVPWSPWPRKSREMLAALESTRKV